ncbi:PAS domain-containing protein, partial [Patulibacter sp. S7RM1-6]
MGGDAGGALPGSPPGDPTRVPPWCASSRPLGRNLPDSRTRGAGSSRVFGMRAREGAADVSRPAPPAGAARRAAMPRQETFRRSPRPLLVCDEARAIVDANAAACLLLRIPPEELVGRPLDALVPPPERTRLDALVPPDGAGDAR